MNISLQLDRTVPVLRLEGRLDARGAASLDEQMSALSGAHWVFDMAKVDYLSSIGIRSLITAEKTLRSRHGRVLLAGLAPFVTRILEIAGLLREFQQFDDSAQAVDAALASQAALSGSSQRTVDGRVYNLGPASPESCMLEVWEGPSIQVTLAELGTAFGIGGLGNALAQTEGLDLTGGLTGFVLRTEGMLIVGSCKGPEEIRAHAILCEGVPRLTPKLDDLKGVAAITPQTLVGSGTSAITIYQPSKVRPGLDKRLKIEVEGDLKLEDEWAQIIRQLYGDCSRVILSELTGGYMARTFRVASYDQDHRRLLPTVLKITTVELTRREEEAHRAFVQRFILNNSTTIMGTATVGKWAALRYNFLGVAGADSKLSWLLDRYENRPTEEVLALFDRLYTRILKPWYGQPRWEPVQLYADHTPLRLFPNVCEMAERQFGFSPEVESIDCPELGVTFPNPFRFLKYEYPNRALQTRLWYQSINHGDLNLRNVLVDENENLYVIDFSETRVRNIVSDFARMETVLKFQIVPLETGDDLRRMIEFEQGLAEAGGIGDVPPNRYRGDRPEVAKLYAVICRLRQHANTATMFETDIVPYWLAALEWTYSVICYDSPPLRKKLAAYSAAIICQRIQELERL